MSSTGSTVKQWHYRNVCTSHARSEMIIQFGYVTLFVVSFPLAPAVAFLSNYVEIRSDALKIMTQMSRPRPLGAEDIGTWYAILDIMGKMAVVSNLAVVIFRCARARGARAIFAWGPAVCTISRHVPAAAVFSNPADAFFVSSAVGKVVLFLLLEHGVFLLKFASGVWIPDIPDDVQLQIDRQVSAGILE